MESEQLDKQRQQQIDEYHQQVDQINENIHQLGIKITAQLEDAKKELARQMSQD